MDEQTRQHHLSLALVNDTQLTGESWKIFQHMTGFVESLEHLAQIKPAVGIFGSARALSDADFSVLSGAGRRIPEAVGKGAHAGRSPRFGLNSQLPHEQSGNPHQAFAIRFGPFYAPKFRYLKYATACVMLPGGFGALDGLSEILTRAQTVQNPAHSNYSRASAVPGRADRLVPGHPGNRRRH